ncbi:hypothetical protein AWR36_006165 [Microbulbifer flavimaris]|uniref:Uncharacterized protein n=1 Tax=Microbulbifer flavimaris TaxID=1781068 RepID=A0ABX4I221_9GAMM|nr:hypothetical protein AWR36_006165 [Microbulbifer flavimaris]
MAMCLPLPLTTLQYRKAASTTGGIAAVAPLPNTAQQRAQQRLVATAAIDERIHVQPGTGSEPLLTNAVRGKTLFARAGGIGQAVEAVVPSWQLPALHWIRLQMPRPVL